MTGSLFHAVFSKQKFLILIDNSASPPYRPPVSTTRPPLNRKVLLPIGLIAGILFATLVVAILFLTGFFITPQEHQKVTGELDTARERISTLESENTSLRQEKEVTLQQIAVLQESVDAARERVAAAKATVDRYVKKEQQVEFVTSRREIQLKELASQIYAIEGLVVEVTESGVMISEVASPFNLGSTRLRGDGLRERLGEIARVFNEFNETNGDQFVIAAVGNTDATPVRPGSGHHSNLWLGAKRAREMTDAMRLAGIPEDVIFLISWGSIKSQAKLFDEGSRRAELFIVHREIMNSVTLPDPTDAEAAPAAAPAQP